jgi:hypothetical protein
MDRKITNIKERILYLAELKGVNKELFFKDIGMTYGSFKGKQKESALNSDAIDNILSIYDDVDANWLITGRGEIIKIEEGNKNDNIRKNMIPLYEDVATIGGTNAVADLNSTYTASIQIDAGDWFKGATAAIRHYEDSMIEYPSGSILAIRELKNKDEIIWGRNYVVETDEMRITKKLASFDEDHIMCYSTNQDVYPDLTLIHQPIKVSKKNIRYISRVLGCVTKEESSGKFNLL